MAAAAPAVRLAALLALCCAALLAGCAGLPFGDEADDAGNATAPAPAAPPAAPVYRLEVAAPGDLRTLLSTYLDLARFQDAPQTERITQAELDRLIAAAPAQARSLLETEGYFNAAVRVEQVPAAAGEAAPLLRVHVEPGPRTLVRSVEVDAAGALKTAAEAGDPAAAATLDGLRRHWPLKPGEPFRQADWGSAKSGTLARLRAEGYPAAGWASTSARVDADANRAQLSAVADSGPLFHLGEIGIEGIARYDEDSVRRAANFTPGAPYSEKTLLDFQERLQKVGLFEGAVVSIDPDPAKAEAAPVTVQVREQPLQQATFGVGVSANTGPRVTLEHLHRRPFGLRWIAKNEFEVGRDRKAWEGELTSYPLDGFYRNLVSGSAEELRTADELRRAHTARIGRTQDTERLERLYFGEVAHTWLRNANGVARSTAVSANYHWVLRDVDSVLLPTRGHTLALQGAVGQARSSNAASGPFTRAWGRYTWYRPLGSWYATVRAEAGQVFAREAVGLPDTLLFRAGGDESVRGYAYRTLGPVVNGVVTSGRVIATGSIEIARPISPKRPAFWWATFIDAGNAAADWKGLDPAVGVGVGLRWRSPVGPLRLDLAHGLDVHRTRLHLSVGIAF